MLIYDDIVAVNVARVQIRFAPVQFNPGSVENLHNVFWRAGALEATIANRVGHGTTPVFVIRRAIQWRAIVLTIGKGAVLTLTGRQVDLMANADLSGLAIT